MMVNSSNIIRITVVGDGDTGKTSMLIAYKDRKFDDRYIPTVFDAYSMTIPINGQEYNVILSDTAGQEDYDKLRRFAYKDADAFLLCYAVNNIDSYENACYKWAPELKRFCPSAKLILVGTKVDLKSPDNILSDSGALLAKKICADAFIENSAKKMYHINETIQMALEAIMEKPSRRKSTRREADCCIIS